MPPKSKKAAIKKRNPVRKGIKKVARFNFSRMRYFINKAVYNANKRYSETKLIACNDRAFDTPGLVAAGVNCYYKVYCLGNAVPAAWTGMPVSPLGGIATAQGDGKSDRTGDYLYLNKTHITMEIQAAESVNGGDAEVELRVIVFKTRRASTPSGITYNPNTKLMINDVGDATGPGILGETAFSLMTRPLNKRDFVILSDKRMRLGKTDINGFSGSYQGDRYSPSHIMTFDLPHGKKCKYSTVVPNEPIDYDYHYGIMILGRALGMTSNMYPGNDWCVNLRGTTSYTDN